MSPGQAYAGQSYHDTKRQPPHQGGQQLQVLCFGHIEKGEGSNRADKNCKRDPVSVHAVQVGVLVPAWRVLTDVVGGPG
jgi:hypothetical protein